MAQDWIRDELKPSPQLLDEATWRKTAVLLPADGLTSVGEVITEQEKARDLYEASRDGIYWFNHFYIAVTKGVQREIREGEYPEFLTILDIEFYGFYRNAMCEDDDEDPVRVAWEPLFKYRGERIDPILFALSGMNAHIPCDLPQAIVKSLQRLNRTEFPANGSAEHTAFTDLNEILYTVAKDCLKTDFSSGVLGLMYRLLARYLKWAGDGYISTVRALAWEQAKRLWNVRMQDEAEQEMQMLLASSASSVNEWILRYASFPPRLGLDFAALGPRRLQHRRVPPAGRMGTLTPAPTSTGSAVSPHRSGAGTDVTGR